MGKQQTKDPNKKKNIFETTSSFGLSDTRLDNPIFISDSKFDDRYNPNMGSLEEFKAREQSSLGALGNKLGQATLKVIPGALEQLGYSLDLENAFEEKKNSFDNSFSEYMRELKESTDEALPVYRDNEQKTFNWSDPKWWIDNGGDVVESIGEFALAGAAISAVTGGAGAAVLARTGSVVNRLGRAGKLVEKGISATAQGASSIALAHAVGGLQGSQVYKDTYQKAVQQGKTIEEAQLIAGDAAATTYNHTVISTGLLNATALSPFFKGGSMGKFLPNKSNSQGLTEYINTLKQLKVDTKGVGNSKLKNALGLFRESGQEALEETGELFSQRIGEKQAANALGNDYEINMFDDEAKLSAFLGAVGGFGMKGGAELVSRLTNKKKEEQQNTVYQQLLDEKINALEKHVRLTKDLKTTREAILNPNIDFNSRKDLEKKLENQLQELQANAFENSLNEDTEGAIEKELEMYNSMTEDEAEQEGLDTNVKSPNYFKSVADSTLKAISNLKRVKDDISNSSLPLGEKEIVGKQKILAEIKSIDLVKAKKKLDNKYEEFNTSLDSALLTQSKTYNKLLAYKELATETTNPLLKEKYKENIEVLENQIESELDLISALSKPVDLNEEQAVLFNENKKKEKTNLKRGLNNPEITQLEKNAIALDSEIQLLNDTYSQIKNNGERKQELLNNIKATLANEQEIYDTESQIENKLDSLSNRFSPDGIKDLDQDTVIENAIEAKKSLQEYKKELKKLPKEKKQAISNSIDKYEKALDKLINKEKEIVKSTNLDKVKEIQEVKQNQELIQDFSDRSDFVETTIEELAETEVETREEPEFVEDNKKELTKEDEIQTSNSLDFLTNINTTLSEWKVEKAFDQESINKAIGEGRKVFNDFSTNKQFVFEFAYGEDGNKIKNNYNGISVDDLFHTTDGILTINTPNVKIGDKVAIVKEYGFGGYISTDGDVPLNVYRIEDIQNGFPIEGAKPLTQLPSDKRAKDNKWEAVTQLRKAVNNSPFSVEAIISNKNQGDINYQFEDGKTRKNSLDTLKTTWIKEGNKWNIKNSEDTPILGYGTGDGTIVIPNKSNLSEYQINRLEDSGYLTDDKGRLVLYGVKEFFRGKHITVVPGVTGDMTAVPLLAKRIEPAKATELFESLDNLLTPNKIETKKKINKANYLGKFIKEFNNQNKEIFKGNAINYTDDAIYIKGNSVIAKISRSTNSYNNFLNSNNFKGLTFYNPKTFELDKTIDVPVEKIRERLYDIIKNQNEFIDGNLLNSKTPFEGEETYYDYIVNNELLTTNVKPGDHASNATLYLDINKNKEAKNVEQAYSSEQREKDREELKIEPKAKTGWDTDFNSILGGGTANLKPYRDNGFEIISKKELNWFKDTIGEQYLTIAKRVDKVKTNGQQAFGYYQNAMVTIAEFAEVGTAYHEAFHFVFNLSTTDKEKTTILDEAKSVYGKNLTNLELEEKLAESFEKYKVTGDLPVKSSKNFFDYIIEFINKLISKPTITNFFKDINNGAYNKDLVKRNINLKTQVKNKLVDGFNNITQKMVIDSIDWQLINSVEQDQIESVFSDSNKVNSYLNKIKENFKDKLKDNEDTVETFSFLLKERPYKNTNIFDFVQKEGLDNLSRESLNEDDVQLVETLLLAKTKSSFFKALLNNWGDKKIGENTIEGFKTKAIKNLRVHGFDVKINNETYKGFAETNDSNISDSVLEEEDGTEDENTERIHDVSFALRSVKKTLSSDLKRALSFIPNYKIENNKIKLDKEGNPELNTIPVLGTPLYLPFDKIYNSLSTKLAGTPIDKIEEKLREVMEKDNSLVPVYEWLVANKNKPIYNKFVTFFDKYNYKFITMVNDKGVPKLIETNRESLDRVIIEDWISNMESKGIISYDRETEEPKIKAIDITQDVEEIKKLLTTKELDVEKANKLFNSATNKIGITIGGNLNRKELTQLVFGKLDILAKKLKQGGNILEENTILSNLALQASEFNTDMFNSSFRNGNGDQVYAINLKNNLVETIDELKNPENLVKFEQDHFYNPSSTKQSLFLKTLKNDKHSSKLDVFLFDSIKSNERGKGKDFTSTNVTDSYLSDLIAYSAQLDNSDYFLMNVGSISDKPQAYYLRLPKLTSVENTSTFEAAKKVMTDTMYQEVTRIKRATNNAYKLNIKNYTNNSKKFNYLPFLNDILLDDEGKLKYDLTSNEDSLNKIKQEATQAIENYLTQQYKRFNESLISNNILVSENKVSEDYKDLLSNVKLEDFFYNDLIWRQETSKVLMGDLAFYSDKNDYNKRSYQLVTPGTKINDNTKYNQAFFSKQIKVNSNEYLASLAQLIDSKITESHIKGALKEGDSSDVKAYEKLDQQTKQIVNNIVKYKKANKTDAQSYVTLDFYKKVLEGTGEWSEEHNLMYNKYWKDGKKVVDQSDKKLESKLLLQPLKPFRYATSKQDTGINGVSQVIPLQIKDSMFPLLPLMANNNKGMKELLDVMAERNIDVASAEDSVKVGLRGQNIDLNKSEIFSLSMRDIRLPLSIPTTKKTNLYGTQLGKLILANINDGDTYTLSNGDPLTGKQLKELFHNSWDKRIINSFNNLKNELGFTYENGEIELPMGKARLEFLIKLRDKLEKENESRDLSDNYFDALQIVKGDIYKFSTDVSFPTLAQRYETVILSLFKNEIIKQEFEGYSNVNVADYGLNKSDELKFITNKDGEIVEAEVGLPFELAEKIGLKDSQYGFNGKINWNLLSKNQQKALQVVLYRIPTQGKNSMIPAKVVKVLPKSNGSAIFLPGEGTVQGGFDFDVDKTFMMFRQVDKEGNVEDYGNIDSESDTTINVNNLNKQKLDNLIFDLHWSILTSKNHIQEVLTPLDSTNLSRKIKEYEKAGLISTNDDVHFSSIVEAKNKESINKYAKTLVGISSLHSTGHATTQQLKDQYTINSLIEIKEILDRDFSEIRDIKGNLISDNIMEWQNAFLDNAKEPISGYLNANTFTGNVLFTLSRLGLDNDNVVDFINQPIIKELTKEYYKTNSYREAKSEIMKKFNMTKDLESNEISIEELAEGLQDSNISNKEFQNKILSLFSSLYKMGQDLSKLNKVLSPDTIKSMISTSHINDWENNIAYLTNINSPSSITIEDSIFSDDSNIKRIQSFYKHGIKSANEFTKKLFPYNSKAFNKIKNDIANRLDRDLTVDEINKVNRALYFNLLSDKLNKSELIIGDNTLVDKLEKLKIKFPQLKDQPLIKALKNSKANRYSNIRTFDFNSGYKRDSSEINKLINSWQTLIDNNTKEISDFAKDLVTYSMVTSAMGNNYGSFIDLVPISYLESSGLNSEYQNLVGIDFSKLDDINYFADHTSDDILRNMYEELVPELDRNKVSIEKGKFNIHLAQSPTDNKFPTYIKVYKAMNSKPKSYFELYKLNNVNEDTVAEYREINRLGDKNKFLELNKNGAILESKVEKNNTGSKFKSFYSLANTIENRESNIIPKLVGEDLENRLNQYASSMGITIQALDNMKAKLGVDANGAADVVNNIIYVAKGDKGLNTLPEEISSFFLEAIEGTALFNQLVNNVADTQEYRNVLSQYKGLYDTDLDYKKEAASKIIADHLIKSQKKKGILGKLIDSLWSRIKSIFSNKNPFEISAEQILSNKVVSNRQGTSQAVFYQLDEDTNYNLDNPKTLEDLQAKMVSVLTRKANTYRNRKSFANKFNQKADDLTKLEAVEAIIAFKDQAKKDYKNINKSYRDRVKEGEVTFDLVRKVDSYSSAYNILTEISDFLRNNKNDLPKEIEDSVDSLEEDMIKTQGKWASLARDARAEEDNLVAKLMYDKSNNSNKDLDSFKDEVKAIKRDVAVYDQRLSSVGYSTDNLLRILGELVVGKKRQSKIKALELLRKKDGFEEVNREYEEWLKSEGIDINDTAKRNEAILEDNQEYFIGEYNEQWQSDISKFYNTRKEMDVKIQEESNPVAIKALVDKRNKYVSDWFKENTKLVKNIKEIVKNNKESLTADQFEDWKDANLRQVTNQDSRNFDVDIDGIKYYARLNSELKVPIQEKHYSEKYKRIQKLKKENPNHPLVKYYKLVVEDYLEAQSKIPSYFRVGRATPGIRKNLMEIFTDSKGVKKLNVIKESFIDNFKRTYDESDRQITDENGEVIQGVPVRYLRSNIEKGEKSLDVATTSFLAQSSILEYEELADIHAEVESIESVLKRRKVYKSKVKKGENIVDTFSNFLNRNYEIVKDQTNQSIPLDREANAYKMGKAFIDRIYYGNMKKDEGAVLGVDISKSVDAILKYTGINALVLNPLQASANAIVGEIQVMQEAIGGRWFNTSDYAKAKKQLIKETPAMISDLGSRTRKSKMFRIMEHLDIFDETIRLIAPELGKDTSKARSLFNTNSLFLFQKVPEFALQATGVLATMNNVDIKNKKGEKVQLYDVIDVIQGKLVVQDDYKDQVNPELIESLRLKVVTVNQKIHGVYNDVDSGSIQAMWWGRAVMFFRKWMKPGLDRRFKRGYYNERLQEEDEGNFVSMAKFIIDVSKDVSKFKFKYLLGNVNDIENMTDLQKANIRKGLAEVYTMVALLFAGMALAADDDDDEEKGKLASFIEYTTIRTRTELFGLMGNPFDLWKVLKSPSASMNTVQDIAQAMASLVTGWEEIERGPNKGMYKVQKEWNDMVPIANGIKKINTIDEQINYLKNGTF